MEREKRETPEKEGVPVRKSILRGIYYAAGILILAMGLTLNTKAGLGVSPIISVPYSISQLYALDFGNSTLCAYVVLVLVEVCLHKGRQRLLDLLQIPFSIVFTRFLNLFADCFPQEPVEFWQQLLVLALAILLTGVGAAMTVNARLIPNPGDGIVNAIAEKIGRSMGFTKNIFDLFCVCITFCIRAVTGHWLVGIGIGTVLAVLAVGGVIALFNHLVKIKF